MLHHTHLEPATACLPDALCVKTICHITLLPCAATRSVSLTRRVEGEFQPSLIRINGRGPIRDLRSDGRRNIEKSKSEYPTAELITASRPAKEEHTRITQDNLIEQQLRYRFAA